MELHLKWGSHITLPDVTPKGLEERVLKDLRFRNPAIGYMMHRNWEVPEGTQDTLMAYKRKDGYVLLPRGYGHQLQKVILTDYPQLKMRHEFRTTFYKRHPYKRKIKLFPHQIKPVDRMEKVSEGILEAPCGSGKSVMGLELICRWGQPTLVLCHTNQIMDQWREYIETFTRERVGWIQGNRFDIENITVASVMTLAQRKMTLEFKRYFGVVILDEAHRAPAYSFRSVLTEFYAGKRIGLTATPRREDGLQKMLQAVVGPVRAVVTEEELIKTGFRMRPKVWMLPSKLYIPPRAQPYDEAIYRAIEGDRNRARGVAYIANKNSDRSVLVLSRRIKHLELMHEELMKQNGDALAVVLTGRVKKDLRKEIVNDLRFGDLNIVFATQLADEGLDIPRLDTIILTFPSSSTMKLEQQLGRIMRSFAGKEEARIYDIYDPKVPRLMKQAMRRRAFYKTHGYPLQT